MTSVTRNLPPFVRELGVSIIGEKCYTSLVENLTLGDVDCLNLALSKGLGVGIVAGGSIMKVPQLLTILSSQSARGLSLPAYLLETLSYAITLAYSYRNEFPFSTYGENLFLTIQNAAITLLIITFPAPSHRSTPSSSGAAGKSALALTALASAAYLLNTASREHLALAQLATLPLSIFSKIPQIAANARARSTGQLSAFAIFAQLAGCLARLFTTMTEVGDPLMTAGFLVAFVLNTILAAQMCLYWGQPGVERVPIDITKEEKTGSVLGEKGTGEVQWGATAPGGVPPVARTQSPVPRYGSPQPGRKWSRKVD